MGGGAIYNQLQPAALDSTKTYAGSDPVEYQVAPTRRRTSALARQALAFGAAEVISIEEANTVEARRKRVMDSTGGFGADMAIECVGHPAAFPEGLELCRDGGAYLVLGQYADAGNVSFNPHTITRKQLRVAGSWGFEPRHVDRALRLLEKAKYRELFERQVTHRFPLGQANEALETVRRLESGKALILLGAG
jgi:threonine dehydrogenase-like Zn-dependent dehydrogenase